MKATLICPGQRSNVEILAECAPLAALPMLGESLVEHWLAHLAIKGFKKATLIAGDRAEQVKALVSDGAKWGLELEVIPEESELTANEVQQKYLTVATANGAAGGSGVDSTASEWVTVLEALPNLPNAPLFQSYAHWFSALCQSVQRDPKGRRLGVREARPGVWCGRGSQVASDAVITGPCWIGEGVNVGPKVVIGPNVILENRVVLDKGCEVVNSWIGPDTFAGALTRIQDSLAWGNSLINWKTGSHTLVPDAFLMCSLVQNPALRKPYSISKRVASVVNGALGSLKNLAPIEGKVVAE